MYKFWHVENHSVELDPNLHRLALHPAEIHPWQVAGTIAG